MARYRLTVDGKPVTLNAEPEMPLLYALREDLGMNNPHFGCGLAQCGYCVSGWIMTAAALLKKNPKASDAELREGLAGLKCRCGTHVSILRAIKRAQGAMS